ncbi:Kef family K(+) transporter [Kaistia dalseonensis]|uniref:CPA2 family monovalent cation:H+ antiporter-2 n=1 Tax=Kaistia dalseonensis TaxID=410840 RepID=A0ABU0H3D6_9HYPH|nr:YbaL family putative K(+) efflux transporter [Kaistia dalseonensis]MCX5494223.1 Kef family K(+) transporter [Kaistia dalseonensis]MDQ0436802.1 CPA2 family monovalent cation:H+ antiporter-2 [Kaistia dalseonensis]
MPHYTPLIATIVIGLVLAFILGLIAHRLRISPLVGYLLAGVLAGPFTPGFVADQNLANELAEIGVILLMFGVGLHFSLKDLMSVKAIAVPGAIVQIAVATLLGVGLGWAVGWSIAGSVVFGLALSVASTVVLLRSLQERRLIDTDRGRIAVGWLIVEDLAMVLALVLLPALAEILTGGQASGAGLAARSGYGLIGILAITIGKVVAFVALMLIVGRRVIPWLLHYVAHTGSRELFRLAVLAIALGVAFGAATLFGVSFALGAFFAGMILSESPLSQRATEETLPLRDAFAVLFFVSVGMLFDPSIVLREPLLLVATLAIILVGKSIAAFLIVRAFGYAKSTALTISASLAQIGEFSFILAALGVDLGLLNQTGRDLILAGAILSILLNPLAFAFAKLILQRSDEKKKDAPTVAPPAEAPAPAPAAEAPVHEDAPALVPTALTDHTIVVGFGRVGRIVTEKLKEEGRAYLVIENGGERAKEAREAGAEVIVGNAVEAEVLAAANPTSARHLLVAIPDAFEAGQIVSKARAINPLIEIIARGRTEAEVAHLVSYGANLAIMGEREIALGMVACINQVPEGAPTSASEPGPTTEAQPPASDDIAATDVTSAAEAPGAETPSEMPEAARETIEAGEPEPLGGSPEKGTEPA